MLINMRYPVDHPQYRFLDSKNPYAEKLKKFPDFIFSDHDAEQFAGRWHTLFQSHPLSASLPPQIHVEIGCNKGHVLLEWARKQPHHIFIGIDWKYKPIFFGAEKAKHHPLHNLKFLRTHAERLPYIFGPQEIDHLYLFFPDPWPKKAQQKNRYLTTAHLKALAPLMKPQGIFHIKTDHDGYFQEMLKIVHQIAEQWTVIEQSHDLHQYHPAPETLTIPEVTLFERLFIQDKIPIKSLKLQPKTA